MKLMDFGEKLFIKDILSKYADTANREKFDDCIIIDLGELTGKEDMPYLVYSIDHPSHIDKGLEKDESYRFYGRWAAACTCGDVLAMGAEPKGFAVDLAAPLDTDIRTIELILEGIEQTLSHYGAVYEGGNFDVNRLETVCMSWGIVSRERLIKRAGAKPGDLIVATGDLGVGWSGYLAKKMNIFDKLSESTQKEINDYNIQARAPYMAMKEVFNLGVITSGMDLTDGIVEFFHTISERNNLGVNVNLENIDIKNSKIEIARHLNVDPRLFSLDPGYDTPLTHGWTISVESWPIVKEIFDKHNLEINCYGEVVKEKGVFLKGKIVPEFWDDQFKKDNLINRWFEFIKRINTN